MAAVDLDRVGRYVDVPRNARRLLEKSEKEIKCTLSLRLDNGEIIDADCYVVYHSNVRGPAKGGIRMDPHVSLDETRGLAERMTYKSSLAGLPFGGGKTGICIDPTLLTRFQKTALLREFCHVLHSEIEHGEYVPAPDMGTNPTDMAVIYGRFDRLDVVTGKPPRVGGLPGRKEATGRGVAHSALRAVETYGDKPMAGQRVVIQGFGNVGSWSAYFLAEQGAKIIAVSDVHGGIHNPAGLDVLGLQEHALAGRPLSEWPNVQQVSNAELLALDTDILIPAASGDQITEENHSQVRAKFIVEGANGPTTAAAHDALSARGVVIVPDILANAGGVIASYVEWRNAKSGSITDAQDTYNVITTTLDRAFKQVVDGARKWDVSLRLAAECISVQEVVEAMKDRSWI